MRKKSTDTRFARTLKAAGAKLGLPEQMVRHLRDSGCDGFLPNGRIDLDRARKWINANPGALKDSGLLDPVVERALLVRARREAVEFELSVRQGQHKHIDDIKRVGAKFIVGAKDKLMQAGLNVAIKSASDIGLTREQSDKVRALMDAEVREALTWLSRGEWFAQPCICAACGKEAFPIEPTTHAAS